MNVFKYLNCLVFEKIALCNLVTDRQTNKQTNRWTGPMHEAALAVVSGGLIKKRLNTLTTTAVNSQSETRMQLTEPGSRVTEAVNPAALEPLPEVYTYTTYMCNDNTNIM